MIRRSKWQRREPWVKDPEVIEAHKKAGLNLDYKDAKELGDLIKAQEVFAKDVVNKLY